MLQAKLIIEKAKMRTKHLQSNAKVKQFAFNDPNIVDRQHDSLEDYFVFFLACSVLLEKDFDFLTTINTRKGGWSRATFTRTDKYDERHLIVEFPQVDYLYDQTPNGFGLVIPKNEKLPLYRYLIMSESECVCFGIDGTLCLRAIRCFNDSTAKKEWSIKFYDVISTKHPETNQNIPVMLREALTYLYLITVPVMKKCPDPETGLHRLKSFFNVNASKDQVGIRELTIEETEVIRNYHGYILNMPPKTVDLFKEFCGIIKTLKK